MRLPDGGSLRTVIPALLLVAVGLLARRSLDAPPVAPERAAALMALHATLFEDVPRPTGSDAAARTRARIVEVLADAGCPPQEHVAWSCNRRTCARVVNLWCRLTGSEPGAPAVVGLAHTDSVAAGPGAADDGAGVVAWVDAVRVLAREPLRRPFVLVLTDGEELGLLGAKAFFRDPPLRDPIGEVVNLEARGTSGASLMFQEVGPTRPWGRWFASAGIRPNTSALYPAVYERLPNDTDLTEVGRAGFAGVNHAFLADLPHYHTPLDDRAHLDPRSLAHHADAALGWVRRLQRSDAGPAVTSVDVLGWRVLWWPTAAGAPASLACAFAWAAWLVVDVRRTRVRARDLALAAGAVPLLLVAATALGEGIGALVQAIAGPVWWGRPWPLRAAVWCATVAGALGLGRVGDPLSRWHAVTGWVAALGVALALLEPRAAVLTLPALALGLGWRLLWRRRPEVGVLGFGPALAATWFPLALGLEEALTLRHPGVVTVPLVLALIGAAPAAPSRPGRWSAALLVAAGLLAGVAASGPAFTPERPQPTAVIFEEGPDGATLLTNVLVGAAGAPVRKREGVAPLGLDGPAVTWLGRSGRAARARVSPARGGRLDVEADVGFAVEGVAGHHRGPLRIVGAGPEGVVLQFDGVPGRLEVGEETPGLPASVGDRAGRFDVPSVPAHDGDRTRVVVDGPDE